MNHGELITAVALRAGITKKDAGAALEAMVVEVTGTLKKGGGVAVANLGMFQVARRAARVGMNPKTRDPLRIPAKKAPVFKAAGVFKDALN